MKTTALITIGSVVMALATNELFAGSATWDFNPASGDWNTAANWSPTTVPNRPMDTATFGVSDTTNISVSAFRTDVSSIVFEKGASAFTISSTGEAFYGLIISGAGIINNSGVTQSFVADVNGAGGTGIIAFENSATAGNSTTFTTKGATVRDSGGAATYFGGTSSAEGGTFFNTGGTVSGAYGGFLEFFDASTAGNGIFFTDGGTVTNSHGAIIYFAGTSTAGNGTFITKGETMRATNTDFRLRGWIIFSQSSTAGNANFTNIGGTVGGGFGGTMLFGNTANAANATFINKGGTSTGAGGGFMDFDDASTADHGVITNEGGAVSGAFGGRTRFFRASIAADSTIINQGGAVSGAGGGITRFFDSSSAGNATLIANSGVEGAGGGSISFLEASDGGTARVEVFGNGNLDISFHNAPGVTVGSIEGDGKAFLGANTLSVGSNNLSTEFSGMIQDGGMGGGTGGSLSKISSGTLSLSGANDYTGGTFVNGGTLLVNNTIGSGTGSGKVDVLSDGTLGGNGTIAGPVTILGLPTAFLSPGATEASTGILTIQSTLTLLGGGFNFELNSDSGAADGVVANGVSITGLFDRQSLFSFTDFGNSVLSIGTEFTVIENTSLSLIDGTFGNLGDGLLFTGGFNTFEVDYQGGDGNDLTLTVSNPANVPDAGTTLSLLTLAVSALTLLRRKFA